MSADPESPANLVLALELDLQLALSKPRDLALPTQQVFEQWVTAALEGKMDAAQLTIRLVESDESASLNEQYRCKQGATNVLSFPFEAPVEVPLPLLGDLVICAPLVVQEAKTQGKAVCAHWAHLVVHGVLHLRGYDHIDDQEAREMEDLEIKIMAYLGFNDPYAETGTA